MQSDLPIGVFDSGVGGLTVLTCLKETLPMESFLYLGDMARLPYGTKSVETVTAYAIQAAKFLINHGVKCLVVGCNTASALSLSTLQSTFPDLPIIGVVEPGASAVCDHTKNNVVAVIGTESTIQSNAYQQALKKLNPDVTIFASACPLFVPFAEEGWLEGEVVDGVIKRYLLPLFEKANRHGPDVLLLACTHFPLLKEAIVNVIGPDITVIDSGHATARVVKQMLSEKGLLNGSSPSKGWHFFVTDSPERFVTTAQSFLGEALALHQVELIDL